MPEDKSIFNVEVNETGLSHIRRIHNLAKVIFWGTLILQLVIIGNFVIRQVRLWHAGVGFFKSSFGTVRMLFYPTYLLLIAIVSFGFWYNFLKFSRRAKASIVANDNLSFNDSFKWVYKTLIFGIIGLGLNVIEFFLAWYFYFK